MDNNNFWRQVFSGANGYASSKRILGAFCLLVCVGLIIYLAIVSKDSDNVKNLIEMMMGVSALLLGINSVTSIWRKSPEKKSKKEDN
jgi:hypothetical protein